MAMPAPQGHRTGFTVLRFLFGAMGLTAFVLGYIGIDGYLRHAAPAPPRWLDVTYYDMQLFVLGSEPLDSKGPYPWQLEFARFAAPVFTLLAVIEAIRILLAVEVRRILARRQHGHSVVCGDSQFARTLADQLYAAGKRVVVVRSHPFGPLEFRRRRLLGVAGDPTSPEVLRGAGVVRAQEIYACTDDDDSNHAIATAVSTLVPGRRSPARLYVQVHDAEMCLSLQARRLASVGSSRLRLDYFNVDDLAARVLNRHHPLRPAPGRPTRILIAGGAPFRRAVLVETARYWRLLGPAPDHPLYVDLIAGDASAELAAAGNRYPFLPRICRIAPHDIELDSLIREGRLGGPYDRIFLCDLDEHRGLKAALSSPALWRGGPGSVFVPLHRQAALAAAFHGAPGNDLLDEVHGRLLLYPVVTRACDHDVIAEDLVERLARQTHEAYLAQPGPHPGEPAGPARVPWSGLSEHLRRANREQVGDIAIKLQALSCVVAPRNGDGLDRLDEEKVEQLARMEHDRWVAVRRDQGWQYGDVRDDTRRRHPDLRRWEEVPESTRDKNREAVRQLPEILADAGFEIVRVGIDASAAGMLSAGTQRGEHG
jgi:hypothetical protein